MVGKRIKALPPTPVHVRAFLKAAPVEFPLTWDLNQVAEEGFRRHHQRSSEARMRWQQRAGEALARWALAKLATSFQIQERHWAYLGPVSSLGELQSVQSRLKGVLEVANGRLPTWRGKLPATSALQDLRTAVQTLQRYGVDVTFDEVAEQFPQYRPQTASIQALNEATLEAAEQAADEANAAGHDWFAAFVQAGRRGHYELPPTLSRYLAVLESKLAEIESELDEERPEWLANVVGVGPLGTGQEFGKYPKSSTSLQRAVVLSLAWNFADGCRRPRIAMSGVINAACSAWFAKPYTAAYIDDLIRPVRKQAAEFRRWIRPPAQKQRKSGPKSPRDFR